MDVLVTLDPGIHFVSAFLTYVLTVSVFVFFVTHVSYFCTCVLTVSVIVSFVTCISYFCMHVLSIIRLFIIFQMTTWSFRDTLAELKMRGHFDESVLWSTLGLCMGDIHFAEIQTTFKMCVVSFCMFLQFIKKGSFNADNLSAEATVIPWLYSLHLSSTRASQTLSMSGLAT